MPKVNCKICSYEFYVKPSHVKLGHGVYCSRACKVFSQRKGKYVNCAICNALTWKQPKAILHSKSQKFFCDKHCQAVWRNKVFSGPLHSKWKGGENIYRKVMTRNNPTPCCTSCGIVNIKVLVVHHIDRNRQNNNMSNLVWLCRNCHYLVHEGKTL
jgi:hypothetical protein